MRTLTDAERALIASGALNVYAWLEIQDPDLAWRDVSTSLDKPDWFNSAIITKSVDSNTLSFNASLLRDTGSLSLCPLRTDSTINRNSVGAYAPMLDLRRQWRIFKAVVAKGVTPTSDDKKEFSRGVIDTIEPQDTTSVINVTGRGMDAILLDYQIEAVRAYCLSGALPLETVIQQVLDDNLGDGDPLSLTGGTGTLYSSGIHLYVPGYSPTFYINQGSQVAIGNVMDAITKLAQLGGLVVGYDYDATDTLQLILQKPNRQEPVEGTGTVSVTTGAATFSTSQAGQMVNGDTITVLGVQYVVSSFDGTTGCILSGLPTFGASAFTIIATAPDWQIGPDEYFSIPQNKLDISGVRNYIDLYYIDPTLGNTDPATGGPLHVISPSAMPGTVSASSGALTFSVSQAGILSSGAVVIVGGKLYKLLTFDGSTGATIAGTTSFSASAWTTSDSITRYDKRYIRIDVTGTVTLTADQAQATADAMRSDLEYPPLQQQIKSYALWFAQLRDYVQFIQNGVHYNSDQFGATTSITHTIANGTIKTDVSASGKPRGRYAVWRLYALTPLTSGLNTPAKPVLTERVNPATGVVDVMFDGMTYANETRCVIRTDRAPTLNEILAGVSGGVGVVDGAALSVATVIPGNRFWMGGVSLNQFGEAGEPNVIPGQWSGIGSTPLATATFGTPVVQAKQISVPVTFGASMARGLFFVKHDDSDPDSSTTAGADVESFVPAGSVIEYYATEAAVVDGVLNFIVNLNRPSDWITITVAPVDFQNQRGPKANIKIQGPGGSPPSEPEQPSLTPGTPTSNTLPITVTFPSSGTAATKIRPYLDGEPLSDVAIGSWSYSGTQAYAFVGLTPGSSHTVQVSIVTSGNVESELSAAHSMTCSGDSSGGGGGTGANGKLPTPTAGSGTYNRPAQSSSLAFTFASGTPSGMQARVWQSSTIGGTYHLAGYTAVASPALADANQTGTPQILYYKLTAYDPTGGYTESDLSSAITVNVPAGSS